MSKVESKIIKPYKGKPLDEWVELNQLTKLKDSIEIHCHTVVDNDSDSILLTRVILTSIRDHFDAHYSL